ncbi:MAG: Ig-like domain-containing protein [Chlorobiaceae bacterium]
MQRYARITKIALLLLSLLSGGCASDRPPSGGTPKAAPLQVVFSDPAPSALNSSPGSIFLTFNHELSLRQLTGALAFTPSIGSWDASVHGKHAEIKLSSPLQKNRTYILTLNKQLAPLQGGAFASPYTLAFSTGPEIENGTISGTVINEELAPAPGSLILAFGDKRDAAGLQPLTADAPDYLAQTDGAGKFSFNHLHPGFYRILAVNDRNGDMRYSPESEEIGICSPEAIQTGTAGIALQLSGLESAAGELLSCRPIDRQSVAIRLARPVNTTSFDPGKIEILKRGTTLPLAVTGWYAKNPTMREREFIIVTRGMEPGRAYSIGWKSGGNDSATGPILFYASGRSPASRQLSATILPENRTGPAYLDQAWPALGKAVIISFSEPIDIEVARGMIFIAETAGTQLAPLRFSLARIDSRTFWVKPDGGFKPGQAYLTSVKPGGSGKPALSRFRSASKEDCGSITGTCFSRSEQVIVEARAEGATASYCMALSRNRSGTFTYTFSDLPPGRYTLSAYAPSDKTAPDPYRQRNPGSIHPRVPAEPFGIYEGKVMVRAQWTTGNIDIHISK